MFSVLTRLLIFDSVMDQLIWYFSRYSESVSSFTLHILYKKYLDVSPGGYKNLCFSAFWLADRLKSLIFKSLRVSGLSGVQWGICSGVGVQVVEFRVVLADDWGGSGQMNEKVREFRGSFAVLEECPSARRGALD